MPLLWTCLKHQIESGYYQILEEPWAQQVASIYHESLTCYANTGANRQTTYRICINMHRNERTIHPIEACNTWNLNLVDHQRSVSLYNIIQSDIHYGTEEEVYSNRIGALAETAQWIIFYQIGFVISSVGYARTSAAFTRKCIGGMIMDQMIFNYRCKRKTRRAYYCHINWVVKCL